jgi:hypothetical protein
MKIHLMFKLHHYLNFRLRFLCEPSCPLWFKHWYFINHKGHKGTQRKKEEC